MHATDRATRRPPLAYRIGAVGHRWNRLTEADRPGLAQRLQSLLRAIRDAVDGFATAHRDLFDGRPAVVRAVSSLASGVDQIFATAATELGMPLSCVLPFDRADFERDHLHPTSSSADAVARYRTLLASASTCLELDGSRADEPTAYGVCGSVVVAHSDIMLVVWDGLRERRRGGTEEALDEALRRGVPVLWIDAHQPHDWQLLRPGSTMPSPDANGRAVPDATRDDAELRDFVAQSLALPTTADGESDEAAAGLRRFYRERIPRWSLAIAWPAFRNVFGRLPRASHRHREHRPRLVESPAGRSEQARGVPVDVLLPYHEWADALGVLNANRYRSTFVLAFLLTALAVGMALLPLGAWWLEPEGSTALVCNLAELVAIAAILVLVFVGARRRWHQRWIDYRLLAEMILQLRIVAPLGSGRPRPRAQAHLSGYGHPKASWIWWYVCALERSLELRSGRLDAAYLGACAGDLEQTILQQIDFHDTAAERAHHIEARLQWCGVGTLVLTLLCCTGHLVLHFLHAVTPWTSTLTALCGFLPALGAAVAGIGNQGEFRRIMKRSRAMAQQLDGLLQHVRAIRSRTAATDGQPSLAIANAAQDAARLMVNELHDWRVVFLDQPLRPPA